MALAQVERLALAEADLEELGLVVLQEPLEPAVQVGPHRQLGPQVAEVVGPQAVAVVVRRAVAVDIQLVVAAVVAGTTNKRARSGP